ncbi:MAG: hypothetical protein ABIP93_21730, partial [Gemmatimonadaceae bacterium]
MHRASLGRARDQLRLLTDAEGDYLASQPFRLVHAFDMRGGRYLVRAHVAQSVPHAIVQHADDVVRRLRASLDEL